MKALRRRLPLVMVALLILAGLIYAFQPQPVGVDLARVTHGPLQVAVREEGRTRIQDRYVVSSPLAGQLLRLTLRPGAAVREGQVLADIEPADPQLLDPRAHAQAGARVRAAEAAQQQAVALLDRARANQEFTQNELERAQRLFSAGDVAREELERAELGARSARGELQSAEFAVQIAGYELEQAEAVLLRAQPDAAREWRYQVRAPVHGRVLRVFQESATVVAPGTPLLELGDPRKLEVEVDVLSVDAVNIQPGARVLFEYWGGAEPLEGRVRLVEPAAFTKISALGVEEQRVWVMVDLVSPPEQWQNLGDAYRVEARIVLWESPDVLKVPTGSLFRVGTDWAVFTVADGRARRQLVEIGRRGEREAEVLRGLSEGDQVVVHPGDRVQEGIAVRARE
jgi:HlyD family secretion protein